LSIGYAREKKGKRGGCAARARWFAGTGGDGLAFSAARIDDDVRDQRVPLVGQQIHVQEVRLGGVAVQDGAIDRDFVVV